MKFYHESALITLLIITALSEVQGINNEQYLTKEEKQLRENVGVNSLGLQLDRFVKIMKENDDLSNMDIHSPPAFRVAATENTLSTGKTIKRLTNPDISSERHKLNTPAKRLKMAKSYNSDVIKIAKVANQENLTFNPPIPRTFRSQKVYCRQIIKSETNHHGNIIESVQHICDSLPNVTEKRKPLETLIPLQPYLPNEKRFRQFLDSSTAKRINCRRVMNSELNELGEIVDSVTEICDPPTTTTRKPIVTTTRKATTTTAEPLVKICRPVMDSYLNEEGKIIDSVTMICKMERIS